MNFANAQKFLLETLNSWWESLVKGLPNFVLAVIVLVIAYQVARLVRGSLRRISHKITKNKAVANLLHTITFIAVLTVGLFMALGILQLEKTVTSLLAGAGVLGLALGFAFQEIAANFVAGILIAIREPYQIGDIVEINGHFGKVQKINMRITSILTFQGLEVIIPNKTMFTQALTNYTSSPNRRLEIPVGVAYSDDLRAVIPTIKEALKDVPERAKDHPIDVFFTGFGSSSIDFEVHVWIEYPGKKNFYSARSECVMRIKEALDKSGHTIPFPIRTLEIDGDMNQDFVANISNSL